LNRTKEKLKYLAGSESGAVAFIVDEMPEEMATQLRAAFERAKGRQPAEDEQTDAHST